MILSQNWSSSKNTPASTNWNWICKVIWSVDIHIHNILKDNWEQYLKQLPYKDFTISNGFLFLKGRKIWIAKWKYDTQNTLKRELVFLLDWRKDSHTAEDPIIDDFSKLLIRIAWDKDKRKLLKKLSLKYKNIINQRYDAQDIDSKIENQAKKLYKELIKWLKFQEKDINLIKEFSWEWKSTFAHCPYFCRCWVIVVCIMKMINLDKE